MKKNDTGLPASTLSEILVVMILAGIVFLSVFDGFSLFQRLLLRIQGRLDHSIERIDSYYRLESLFSGSDSIRGDAKQLDLYRRGAIRERIRIDDSLLVVTRPGNEMPPDTLLRGVSEAAIVRNPDFPERIDSLLLVNDTIRLRLGVRIREERRAEAEIKKIEQSYPRHEDQ